jgi:peptidoglycan/LPS O-acetylase OafA/YrhL
MTKRVYRTLNGMRGVAALAVAPIHAGGMLPDLGGGFLAVDLFFILSGFVIAHAYERRFEGGMTAGAFMKARLVRLYPLYALGTMIGLFSAAVALKLGAGELSPLGLVLAAFSAVFMVPSIGTVAESVYLFPLNSPAWSLFYELIANLFYVLAYRWLTNSRLAAIVAVSGIALAAASLTAGHAWTGPLWANAAGGLPRVMFGFPLGVLLYRFHLVSGDRVKHGVIAWAPLCVLPILFCAHGVWLELVIAMTAFPLLIYLAADLEPGPRSARVFTWLGVVSYPLYAVHAPVFEILQRAIRMFGRNPAHMRPAGIAALVALVIGGSLLDRLYDEPVRAWFNRRRAAGRAAG